MRIGIIGHFGGTEIFTDGQTVKVKSLYNGLENALPQSIKIDIVDTYYLKHNKIKLFNDFMKCLIFDGSIIFLPATNGRKILFKLMYIIQHFFHKNVYHDCIGGALVKELKKNPKWIVYLNSFKVNWMESQIQVDALEKLGIKNAKYLPNFKNIKPLQKEELNTEFGTPLKFCTFSRVLPEKGIEDAAIAISNVNNRYGEKKVILDIYGPIQPGYEEWFEQVKKKYGDNISYKGIIDPSKSVQVLKQYYSLLFPTRYYTEGMPGTIIDAFFSGVPVISRRWAYCNQMITDDYNGISYNFDNPKQLDKIILKCVENPDYLVNMRKNCILDAQKYTEVYVINKIIKDLDIGR